MELSKINNVEEKEFNMIQVCTDVRGMEAYDVYYGKKENHFNITWRIRIVKEVRYFFEFITIYLDCLNCHGTDWSIETEIELKVSKEGAGILKSHVFEHKKSTEAFLTSIKQSELEDYLIDDHLTVDCHVNIKNTVGVKLKLRNFDESAKEYSDVALIVEEEKFYVCKMFLASHSSYFKTLFMENKDQSKKTKITLQDVNSYDFQNFLELIHGESNVDENTVEGILHLADIYGSRTVIRRCEEFLVEKSEKSLRIKFHAAIKYNMDQLKSKCLTEMKTINDVEEVIPEDANQFDSSVWKELLMLTISIKGGGKEKSGFVSKYFYS